MAVTAASGRAAVDRDEVPRQRARVLFLILVVLCATAVIVARSRELKPPPPTGLAVRSGVTISAPLRVSGAPLECQEVRLSRTEVGVRVYSKDAGLSGPSSRNLEFWVDVQLMVDGRTVSGTVLGTPDDPFGIGSGGTLTGVFGGTPSLDRFPSPRWALVTSDGRPVRVPEGRLTACTVAFVEVPSS